MYVFPSDLLDLYHAIPVTTPQGSFTISVNRYRSRNPLFGGGSADAEEVKDGFLGVSNNKIVAEAGGGGPLVRVFVGKGAPDEFATVLALVAKYKDDFVRTYKNRLDTRGQCARLMDGYPSNQTQDMLQAFTDKYLGLDCNGWVGNFVKLTQKSSYDPDTEVSRYYYHNKGVRRTVDQVLALDIMVWANFQHMALIGSYNTDRAEADVYQSTDDGQKRRGPQHAVHTLVADGNGLFHLSPASVVGGQFYVVSLDLLTA